MKEARWVAARQTWRSMLFGPLGVIIALKVVLTLAADSRYGYHRDELYYLAASRRLAWGYVDFPPITPVIGRLTRAVLGSSLLGLRVPAMAAGVGVVLLTAAMARHLGGSRRAQWIAGLTMVTTGFLAGVNGLLETVSFDTLAWALALYALVRLVTSSNPAWWLALGAAVGVGMMTKYTMPALVAGLAVATALTPLRRDLRTPWPWLGGLIALVLFTPNLWWQVAHGWPSLAFLRGQNARVRRANPPLKYVSDQLLFLGPIVVGVAVAGAVAFWRDARRRGLVLVAVVVELIYLVLRGRGYYPLDALPVLVAGGAVAMAEFKRWRLVVAGLVAWAVVGLPIAYPVLPQRSMLALGLDKVRDDYSAELGWPVVVSTIAQAYRSLPPSDQARAGILTRNYSQAGAVDLFGPRLGLPRAASGHNSYWLWFPRRGPGDVVVAVGFSSAQLSSWYRQVSVVGSLPRVKTIDVEERGATIAICRDPRISPTQLRAQVKQFT